MQIWLNLVIFILISALILKLTKQDKLNFTKSLENIIQLITYQSANELLNCRNKLKFNTKLSKTLFIAFICVWIQSASILSKAFTGLLLESYVSVKSVPIVNDLIDVHNNPELKIASDIENFKVLAQYQQQYSLANNTVQSLLERAVHYISETKLNLVYQLYDNRILHDLILGQLVIITNYETVKDYQNHFKKWGNRFKPTKITYIQKDRCYGIKKKMFLAKKIRYMYDVELIIVFLKLKI